jgi:hypothetical protein
MTITATTRRAGPFIGNGAQTVFPFAYKVFTVADVLVVEAVIATGVEVVKTLTSHYTVSLNVDQEVSPGGLVVMLVAPPVGSTLTLGSQVAETQEVAVTNNGGWYPEILNGALDKATILIQQLKEKLGRALVFPVNAAGSSELPVSGVRAGRYLAFDAGGNPITSVGTGSDATLRTDLAAGSGSALMGHIPSGVGAVATTVQAKLRLFMHAEDKGAVGNGITDDSAAIQSALTNNKYVLLTPGKTYLASGLEAVAGGALICIGGRAKILVAAGANAYGMIIRQSNFILDGVDFDGGNMGPWNVAAPTPGNRIGLSVGNGFGVGAQLQNITVQNSEIYGFDKSGLYGGEVQIGFVFGKRVTLHNVNCHHNYVNIWCTPRFEYVNATLCYGYEGFAGVIVAAGNNKFSNCSFENNYQNCQLTIGENNSHGGFSNCSFNHCAAGGLGLYAFGIEYGMAFTNCFFWYAPIHLDGATGVQIRNSEIANSAITISGGGTNSIDDNYTPVPIVPTLVGFTFTTFRRNRVAASDVSLAPVYGDLYGRATSSAWGAFPLVFSTAGAPTTMKSVFATKKWHGVESAWLQSGDRLLVGISRQVQVDAFIKINIGAAAELITLTVARYNGAGTLMDSFSSSGAFVAGQAGAVVSVSTRMICQGGDAIDILLTTATATGGTVVANGYSALITSVD